MQADWKSKYKYLSDKEIILINNASEIARVIITTNCNQVGGNLFEQSENMLNILANVKPDAELIAACLIYPFFTSADLPLDLVQEQLGDKVAKLLASTRKMAAIKSLVNMHNSNNDTDFEQLRKMILAMINDVRIIIIKIVAHLSLYEQAKHNKTISIALAKETKAIYAPLANRLGITELKWQLEDFAFRFLHEAEYKKIAKALSSKRKEREIYADDFMLQIQNYLRDQNINPLSISSRVKHIYSIYLKMQRKNKTLAEIYDQTAIRIILPDVAKCYSTLSMIHMVFDPIEEEFDDYIASPKPNGYKSIHTAVYGPDNKVIEIQIRTQNMHEFAEFGIAAHWLYKEGKTATTANSKAKWLDNLVAWHEGLSSSSEPEGRTLFKDEVFVFTPGGDVKSLAVGATMLDFAYAIHSEVGHRCKGAIVNSKIVPLKTKVNNGDVIEILTNKNCKPSRDWLDTRLGYINTNRARAKVLQWFRAEDLDRNIELGHDIVEKALRKHKISPKIALQKFIVNTPYSSLNNMYADVARGHYTVEALMKVLSGNTEIFHQEATKITKKPEAAQNILGNTMSHLALCCKPTAIDEIIGYVTIGRGISIHKANCHNILNVKHEHKARLLEVSWEDKLVTNYALNLSVLSLDSDNTIRDITQIIHNKKINIINLECLYAKNNIGTIIKLGLNISEDLDADEIIQKISKIVTVCEINKVI